mmetsp:Transcript_18089/g.42919  ORF Transcript_18089/g.42919 Transcript_18089/m.42919 type:complete len:265 (-) Transcript_18089:1543-2337(-)
MNYTRNTQASLSARCLHVNDLHRVSVLHICIVIPLVIMLVVALNVGILVRLLQRLPVVLCEARVEGFVRLAELLLKRLLEGLLRLTEWLSVCLFCRLNKTLVERLIERVSVLLKGLWVCILWGIAILLLAARIAVLPRPWQVHICHGYLHVLLEGLTKFVHRLGVRLVKVIVMSFKRLRIRFVLCLVVGIVIHLARAIPKALVVVVYVCIMVRIGELAAVSDVLSILLLISVPRVVLSPVALVIAIQEICREPARLANILHVGA